VFALKTPLVNSTFEIHSESSNRRTKKEIIDFLGKNKENTNLFSIIFV